MIDKRSAIGSVACVGAGVTLGLLIAGDVSRALLSFILSTCTVALLDMLSRTD